MPPPILSPYLRIRTTIHCRSTHNTVGITDFHGQGNRFEANDVSGCAMGIRLWQARGSREQRLMVTNNIMHFNTQPVPWWWSGGDGAAIVGAGVAGCRIPIRLMAGDYLATVGLIEPEAGAIEASGQAQSGVAEALGRTPVGPAAIWGLCSPLSRILRSERVTKITGWGAFWSDFAQPSFHAPGEASKAFVAVLADDVVQLVFENGAPCYSSPALKEGQVWEWACGVVDISRDLGTCGVRYSHRRAGEKGVVGCAALWLYPLDGDDLAKLDAFTELRTSASVDGTSGFSMPGGRRFYKPQAR